MDKSRIRYNDKRIKHWDNIAFGKVSWFGCGKYYHSRLTQIYKLLVPPGSRVLEIGCAQGDLLASLNPALGVGVDFSKESVHRAKLHHPELSFYQIDAHDITLDEKFDFIILSDLLNDLWDVQLFFKKLEKVVTPNTRIIMNNYSRLWEPILTIAKRLRLAKPTLYQNWLTIEDISNLLKLENYEIIHHWSEILFPLQIPALTSFINKIIVKIWPFRIFALTNFILAKPIPKYNLNEKDLSVSVIIPARNEEGNIYKIMKRVPNMGCGTELVFVEGHSKDKTFEIISQAIDDYPDRQCKLLRQTGEGKGDAVRLGFEHAEGDVLMILDADMTVPPEDLPRFFEALTTGKGDFINGVRLIYPMENQAMRFWNLVGNKFFSLVFSFLLGQPVKDTLCGTKVLKKIDYDRIAKNRTFFGDFDPFGDFDLLFGASKLNLKIVDLPVRYRERTYGTTNIHRWKHGWLLLRMALLAARRLKFI